MSNMLALVWGRGQVCGVEGHAAKGAVRLRKGFVAAWPDEIDAAEEPQRAGQWLKEQLQRAGIASRQVAVVLPREECVIRRLDLPDAPDEELADLVRFQAATASSVPLERLLLDFLPLPRIEGTAGRVALLASVMKDRIDPLRAACEAAGLELLSLGIAPAATAELVARLEQRRGDDPHPTSLCVVRQERRVELALVRGHRLVLAHSAELPGESEPQDMQRLLAEISRLLVPLKGLVGSDQLARTWVIDGTGGESLAASIAERFGCMATTFDPLAPSDLVSGGADLSGPHGNYVAPVGALLAAGGRLTEAVDFLNPRKPPVKQDRRKYRIAVAAAVVLVLAGLGYGSILLKQSDLDRAIAGREKEIQDLDEFIKLGEPVLASAKLIDEWSAQRVDWLVQLRQFATQLPGRENVYLTDIKAAPATGDALARIQATGFAREPRYALLLYQKLSSGTYRVRPQGTPRPSDRDPEYPYRFEVDVELLAAAPTPKGTRSRK